MSTHHRLASRVVALDRPGTTAGHQVAQELSRNGHEMLALSGVSPWGPPAELVARAMDESKDAFSVAPSAGLPDLRNGIAQKLSRENGMTVDGSNVLVTHGAKEAIQVALHCVADPGGEIIIPLPAYPYEGNVTLAGMRPVYVETSLDRNYCLDVEAFRASVSSKTRGILLCNPVNPTGRVIHLAELEALAELATERDLWVIVDESFEKLVYPPNRHTSMASLNGLFDRTITIQTFSKVHGMGAWRLGYLAAASNVIQEALKVHEWLVLSVNAASQILAKHVLSSPQDWVEGNLRALKDARDLSVDTLKNVEGVRFYPPDAGGNLFLELPRGATDTGALSAHLVATFGLSTLPGSVFGCPTAIRFSAGGELETVKEGLRRFQEAMESYVVTC